MTGIPLKQKLKKTWGWYMFISAMFLTAVGCPWTIYGMLKEVQPTKPVDTSILEQGLRDVLDGKR